MKFIPILTRRKKSKEKKAHQYIESNTSSEPKLRLNTVLNQLTTDDKSLNPGSELPEITVAAIAAAICAHTGKKPKQLVITTPSGAVEEINLWATAGRQDLMLSRDITGQVGFQY